MILSIFQVKKFVASSMDFLKFYKLWITPCYAITLCVNLRYNIKISANQLLRIVQETDRLTDAWLPEGSHSIGVGTLKMLSSLFHILLGSSRLTAQIWDWIEPAWFEDGTEWSESGRYASSDKYIFIICSKYKTKPFHVSEYD